MISVTKFYKGILHLKSSNFRTFRDAFRTLTYKEAPLLQKKISPIFTQMFFWKDNILITRVGKSSRTETHKHRSSRPEMFCKKDVLRNFAKFTGKHLCQSLSFSFSLYWKRGSGATVFLWILWNFQEHLFLQNTWLLLRLQNLKVKKIRKSCKPQY